MFAARPDLMDGMFSRSSQLEGTQPRAACRLHAVFASYIVEHPVLLPRTKSSPALLTRHASLGLKEEELPHRLPSTIFEAIAA